MPLGPPTLAKPHYEVWLEKDLKKQGWSWRIVSTTPTGDVFAVQPVSFIKILEEEVVPEAFTLPDTSLQQIMNQLWNAGFRPNSEGSEGELQATKKHLEDMRKIVFDMIGLQK